MIKALLSGSSAIHNETFTTKREGKLTTKKKIGYLEICLNQQITLFYLIQTTTTTTNPLTKLYEFIHFYI